MYVCDSVLFYYLVDVEGSLTAVVLFSVCYKRGIYNHDGWRAALSSEPLEAHRQEKTQMAL